MVFTGTALRSRESVAANRLGQSALWPHAISGDLPIVLARLASLDELALAGELLRAHAYWHRCGVVADLVLLNVGGSADGLHERLEELVAGGPVGELTDKPGGVFLRAAEAMSAEDVTLLEAAARAILRGSDGSLAAQLARAPAPVTLPAALIASGAPATPRENNPPRAADRLLFGNGLGGFTPDAQEYIVTVRGHVRPPAPWSNVLANETFGCLITEAGAGYTWAGNAQMNRLTPWSNDPVSDPPGEALYLRDEETGEFWSPAPAPCGGETTTVVRHGQGYTRFSRTSHGVDQELLVLLAPSDPVKLVRLRAINRSGRPRRLSATFYAEWVLGVLREQAALQVVCTLDEESGALFARNAWAGDFAGRIAFADVARRPRSFTTDRAEFLGRYGTLEAPAALGRARLADRAGELCDPCVALMTVLDLPAGGEDEVVFMLGQAESVDEARRLVRRYGEAGRAQQALEDVRAEWDRILGAVQVRTPDPALDAMLNRWLLYQTLACRVWGRSGVLPVRRGVRLPRSVAGCDGARLRRGVAGAVADRAGGRSPVRRRRCPALVASAGWPRRSHPHLRRSVLPAVRHLPLRDHHRGCGAARRAGAVSAGAGPSARPGGGYALPDVSEVTGTIYEHCVRALEHGLRLGPHGLPLMGTGDWNDGMNRVGAEGTGESIWNGWFMLATLREFAPVAEQRGDAERASWCRERAEAVRLALEEHAWDGGWYLRAFFDDGTPLGSSGNDECQIDSIAQSWSVISGAGDPARARQAMASVEARLVHEVDQTDPAVHAAVRSRRARARLHQGLRGGHSRKRRAVHPRRDLGGARHGHARSGRARPGAVRAAQSHQACRHA